MVPADAWDRTIDFYRELIDVHGWRQEPMLDFVLWLAAGPYRDLLHPSGSHEKLGLATVPTFEERLQLPIVYIGHSERRGFVVYWQKGQGHTLSEEQVSSPQSPEVFEPILDWLGIAEEPSVEPDAVLRTVNRAPRAMVFLSVPWSGPERIARSAFSTATQTLAAELPDLGVNCFLMDEEAEWCQDWLSTLGLANLGGGTPRGAGSMLWLEFGRAISQEANGQALGANGIIERCRSLWQSDPTPQS